MFFNQPLSARFGTELSQAIESERWSALSIAVAWVRASGLAHLNDSLTGFLNRGGVLRTIVGVDFDNTSQEGLQALLDLESYGDSKSFVYHNESSTVFHPKLYLFRSNAGDARLIVGSNNLTEAGLFRNTEAGLQLDLDAANPVLHSVENAFDSWRDSSTGLVHPLTSDLLSDLIENDYVKSEELIRKEAAEKRASQSRARENKNKIFASVPVGAPTISSTAGSATAVTSTIGTPAAAPATTAAPAPAPSSPVSGSSASAPSIAASSAQGTVLLMRVRKAHATDRPTQTQLPKAVTQSPFFSNIHSVTSSHSGEVHGVRAASARNIVNTLKLEIPEMRDFNDPVVRFELTSGGMRYEVYDSSSPRGAAIIGSLLQGQKMGAVNPTKLTRPNDPASATWWRFI